MTTAGTIAALLLTGAAIVLGVHLHIKRRMAQSFALGMKVGAIARSKGQSMIDEQLRSCGIDPDELP